MKLTNKAIEDFNKIYHRKCGISLSNEEATIMANNFFNMMRIFYKINKNQKT